MTRRSMPSSFHANLFALEPARCPSSTYGVVLVGTWGYFFLVQWGQVTLHQVGGAVKRKGR